MSGGATEWEDILIQHGVMKAPPKPEDNIPEVVFNVNNDKNDRNSEDSDLDDEEFFKSYRYHFPPFYPVMKYF